MHILIIAIHNRSPGTVTAVDPSNVNAGHRFLQPSANSISAGRKVFPGSSPSESASIATSNSAATAESFSYHQSVVPIVDSSNLTSSGVTLPVGLPVVALPGLLHEVNIHQHWLINRTIILIIGIFFSIAAFGSYSFAESNVWTTTSQAYGNTKIHHCSTGGIAASVGETHVGSVWRLGANSVKGLDFFLLCRDNKDYPWNYFVSDGGSLPRRYRWQCKSSDSCFPA